jgi:hypothetical protein
MVERQKKKLKPHERSGIPGHPEFEIRRPYTDAEMVNMFGLYLLHNDLRDLSPREVRLIETVEHLRSDNEGLRREFAKEDPPKPPDCERALNIVRSYATNLHHLHSGFWPDGVMEALVDDLRLPEVYVTCWSQGAPNYHIRDSLGREPQRALCHREIGPDVATPVEEWEEKPMGRGFDDAPYCDTCYRLWQKGRPFGWGFGS